MVTNALLVLNVKYFLKNVFSFSSVRLQVKYGQSCKIFYINHKIVYKKL